VPPLYDTSDDEREGELFGGRSLEERTLLQMVRPRHIRDPPISGEHAVAGFSSKGRRSSKADGERGEDDNVESANDEDEKSIGDALRIFSRHFAA
ncbi:unnamed protein product, partial [Amoebophrya sp. A25]